MSDLSSCAIGIATPSLGMHSSHTLPLKLEAAAKAGFAQVELGFDDLLAWTLHEDSSLKPWSADKRASWAPSEPDPFGEEDLWKAVNEMAKKMGAREGGMCHRLKLGISILQPFSQFEGWPVGFERRKWVWKKAERWLEVADNARAAGMQIGSNDSKDTISDFDYLAKDLAGVADLAAKRNLRISYEPWCWGIQAPTWESTWDLVRRANRPNLGLCLDTFQHAGYRAFADPCSKTGWSTASRSTGNKDGLALLQDNLRALATSDIPPEKIHLLQISDARRCATPLGQGGKDDEEWQPGMQAREVWSHGSRPPQGQDGYLPVAELAAAVFATGFRGLLSYEVFELAMSAEDANVPTQWAQKCKDAHADLLNQASASKLLAN